MPSSSALGATDRVTHALVGPLRDGTVGDIEALPCDALLVSGGWNPAVHLFSQTRGRLRYDEQLGAFLPGEQLDGLTVAGSAAGVFTLAGCLADGHRAAREALTDAGIATRPTADVLPAAADTDEAAAPLVLWRVPGGPAADGATEFVDLQRDATVADIARAVGAGLTSIEHIKRYTTIGTAHDQGKTSGIIATGITAELLGVPVADTGTTTFRPPYTPVAFAALAGRDRGRMFDPERVTALHDWHLRAGAVFEDVGQWKRPRYYPQAGEDMDAAVLRECAATRTGVGILDGSTLGKIDVQGPDAATFLDLIYTNLMSSLKVGAVRYGVMCGVDGMVIDDGTVLRLADEQFLVLTTTGGAARILDWMEEWLQTEWPHLRVYCTSVTEQWVTFPVVGPTIPRRHRRRFPRRRRLQRGLPVHGHPGHHPGRRPGPAGPDQLLRRVGLRGVCQPVVRGRRVAAAARRRRPLRDHPVRHGNHARPARGEGLPDHRPGHRRHRQPPRPRLGLGGVEEEGRLHRQTVLRPGRQLGPAAQTTGRDCSRWIGALCYRRARRSSSSSRTANCRHRRCRCSAT